MGAEEEFSDSERRRRLAGAADRQIAEADHRNADALPWRLHTQRGHGAIDGGERTEHAATAGPPPKVGLTHERIPAPEHDLEK